LRLPEQVGIPAIDEEEKLTMSAALRGRQVLIVEDEALVIMMLEDMLNALGCRVVGVATTLDEGLAAIERGPRPDAVVLDLNLEGSHSYRVADALVTRGVPFLIVTGYGEDAVAESYRHQPILRKPFRDEDLAKALADTLGAAGDQSPAGAVAERRPMSDRPATDWP
jgi:CheY-like chemotaxis protein